MHNVQSELANQRQIQYDYKHFMHPSKIGRPFAHSSLDQSVAARPTIIGWIVGKPIQIEIPSFKQTRLRAAPWLPLIWKSMKR